MSLQYHGILGLPHSWAVVATEILLELRALGKKFSSISTNGTQTVNDKLKPTLILPEYKVMGGVRKTILHPPLTDVSISYTIPPNLPHVRAKSRIHIYNFETTILPPGWGKMMNDHAHLILPSSQFSKDIFAANGVSNDKMVVLPHGFNPAIYNPQIEKAQFKNLDPNKFKFLTVAISHWRKGYDLLIKAYIEEFKDDDSVVLFIKSSTDPLEAKNIPCVVDVQQVIADLKRTHNYKWPEIRLITTRFDNLARLYNSCNAVVLPTRTECFSLTTLEAAACKVPVITTNYGGHLDFLNKDNSYLIDYKMRLAPPQGQYWGFQKDAQLAEPDIEHLKSLMRHVKNNYAEAQAKADKAFDQVKDLTWSKVTNNLVQEIKVRGWNI